LVRGLASCCELAEVYLRKPSKADAHKITAMHQNVHKVPGRKNCPTELKGQFQGQEKCATIALESIVDYNLWFWHASFGYPV